MDFSNLKSTMANGTELAYVEIGEGDPVVFVHGAISDMRTWHHQLTSIGEHYRAISYSRRYARPNKNLSPGEGDPWQVHVDDLADFLQAVDAVPAHLVGNSQGAFLGMVLARDKPKLVRSLILEEPAALALVGSVPPKLSEILSLTVRRPRLALELAKFEFGVLQPMRKAVRTGNNEEGVISFSHGVLGDHVYDGLPVERKQQILDNQSTVCAFALNPQVPAYSPEDAAKLNHPVLLLNGEISPDVLLALIDWVADIVPSATRATVPRSSHFMHEENPSGTNAAILDLLKAQN